MQLQKHGQIVVVLAALSLVSITLLASTDVMVQAKQPSSDLELLAFAETIDFDDARAADEPPHLCRKCQELAAANQKIDAATYDGFSCSAPARPFTIDELALSKKPLNEAFEESETQKARTVGNMVAQALKDQVALLRGREAELERWDRTAQAHFAKWFGTTDNKARELIYERIGLLNKINTNYGVTNFRRAVPSRRGVFAFVYATDASKVFLDKAFVQAPAVGTNSRVGTITHEMSHFKIAGGTEDHAYGTDKCKALARTNSVLALTNADNFEFYMEGAK